MSYFKPADKITVNNQESLEYAIYFIFGSYFRKTRCASPDLETTLRINYIETRLDTQYALEEMCDEKAAVLFRKLPAWVADSEAKVSFIRSGGSLKKVRFTGDNYILTLTGKYRKHNSSITAEVALREC